MSEKGLLPFSSKIFKTKESIFFLKWLKLIELRLDTLAKRGARVDKKCLSYNFHK